jgi:hypothetical protein
MRASLMTRAGSVAAAAVLATTGAVAVAGAADASTAHHHRLPTHLAVAKRRAFEHGHRVTVLSGRLSTVRNVGLDRRVVFLDRITSKGLVQIGRERTGVHGRVAFVVAPKATARFVLIFKGTELFHSSHSRVVVVKH